VRPLRLGAGDATVRTILCLGAHADDIEIGCGGTLLRLLAAGPVDVHWIVFSGAGDREAEARRSACLFLQGAAPQTVAVQQFQDAYFPYIGAEIKAYFSELQRAVPSPDVVFTHYRNDGHQDHRLISELTGNTFRDHLVLEYEIPKYDGDLSTPNCYVPLDEPTVRLKLGYLLGTFASQRDKSWFTDETFRGLMRVRGVECRAPGGYAEAFYARKLVIAP
jgi:LmbE family N-acetylglucosaminyl deacetylase